MKKLFFITQVVFALIFYSCGQNKPSEKQTIALKSQETVNETDNLYKIISEKEHVDPKFGYNKCNLKIELNDKISIDKLKSIAYKLRETRRSYDKLWIFYSLAGTTAETGAWAISHFTPNLEVQILGATYTEDEKMNSVSVDGKIIGRWQDVRPMAERGMIIYEKNNKIYMKHTFSDGSTGDYEFIKKKYDGKMRFEPKQNMHQEYYLIENNGNLGMYGKDGKFSEAIKKVENNKPKNVAAEAKEEIKKYQEPKVEIQQPVAMLDEDFARKAYVIAMSFVEQSLKSPKSADFPFLDYTYSKVENNTITIRSYVDAQNSLGAEIRNKYVIVLKLVGSEWTDISNWKILSLKFE